MNMQLAQIFAMSGVLLGIASVINLYLKKTKLALFCGIIAVLDIGYAFIISSN